MEKAHVEVPARRMFDAHGLTERGWAFADNKLGFNLDIFNALNQQRPVQTDPSFPASFDPTSNTIYVNNYYRQPLFTNPPRTVRLSVTYDY